MIWLKKTKNSKKKTSSYKTSWSKSEKSLSPFRLQVSVGFCAVFLQFGFANAEVTNASEKVQKAITVLILGDSLTEGYGVAKEKAFPALLEQKLTKDSYKAKVINAGLGGATSASALSRLKWSLRAKPSVLLLALGANDGLRGIAIESTKKNLADTIELAIEKQVVVILAGMQLPPNYGEKYSGEFRKMYQQLATEKKVKMIPFLLKGVAGRSEMNLPDGIHPNEKGHEVIATTVYGFLADEVGFAAEGREL